jgi:hypothetical protein
MNCRSKLSASLNSLFIMLAVAFLLFKAYNNKSVF